MLIIQKITIQMKYKAIQSTVLPDMTFNSAKEWFEYLFKNK